MKALLGALVALIMTAGTAVADRPVNIYVPQTFNENATSGATTHTIFLNNCEPNGCAVHHGSDNSATDTSSISSGGQLSAFQYDATTWNNVVACVKDVFRDFNVDIVTTRPASGSDYLEILIAGSPTQVGFSSTTGGVAPFPCGPFIDRVVVFDFANVWQGNVDEICATAAQEIAHTWALDHVTDSSDPMTYFSYTGRRYYKDGVQCGSDCVNASNAPCKVGDSGCHDPYTGRTCTTAQTHVCACSSQNTQNDIQTITSLFGAGTPTPPTTTITRPSNGDNVQPGFPVVATVSSPYGTPQKAELRVDGQLVVAVTSMPYVFNSPSTLGPGSHTVEVTGYDLHGVSSKQQISVYIGMPCQKPADCPNNTDTCIGGRCVAGPGVQGGLGMSCTDPSQCASGQCASDGTSMYCVEPCMVGQCPTGFGCTITSGTMGVCWPGYNDGSSSGGGGCDSGGAPGLFGLTALAGLLALRRRRA